MHHYSSNAVLIEGAYSNLLLGIRQQHFTSGLTFQLLMEY